jgi:hypothetical protein
MATTGERRNPVIVDPSKRIGLGAEYQRNKTDSAWLATLSMIRQSGSFVLGDRGDSPSLAGLPLREPLRQILAAVCTG